MTAVVNALIEKLNIPVFVAPMGKGIVDESPPNYAGVYAGDGSHPDVKVSLESSDLIFTIGNIRSDINTVEFTYSFSQLDTIDLHCDYCDIGYAKFEKVYFHSLIPRLTDSVDASRLQRNSIGPVVEQAPPSSPSNCNVQKTSNEYSEDAITHSWIWPRISIFLQEHDIIITDPGTSYVGYWETKLPKNVKVINQLLWSSIGYGVPAAQGAALAARDIGKGQRVVCFEGDGMRLMRSIHMGVENASLTDF